MKPELDSNVDGDLRAPLKTSPSENAPGGRVPPALSDESTGLPWPRTWRGVYLAVAGIFIGWVTLLTVLTKLYS